MPHSMVEPSSTRRATFSPMRRRRSSSFGVGASTIGSSKGTSASIWLTWMKLSPSVRGIRGLTWAITYCGVGGGGLDDVHRHAQAAQAAGVRRRDRDQRHVHRDAALLELLRDLREEDGRVVADAPGSASRTFSAMKNVFILNFSRNFSSA